MGLKNINGRRRRERGTGSRMRVWMWRQWRMSSGERVTWQASGLLRHMYVFSNTKLKKGNTRVTLYAATRSVQICDALNGSSTRSPSGLGTQQHRKSKESTQGNTQRTEVMVQYRDTTQGSEDTLSLSRLPTLQRTGPSNQSLQSICPRHPQVFSPFISPPVHHDRPPPHPYPELHFRHHHPPPDPRIDLRSHQH